MAMMADRANAASDVTEQLGISTSTLYAYVNGTGQPKSRARKLLGAATKRWQLRADRPACRSPSSARSRSAGTAAKSGPAKSHDSATGAGAETEAADKPSTRSRTSATFECAVHRVDDDLLMVTVLQTLVLVDLGRHADAEGRRQQEHRSQSAGTVTRSDSGEVRQGSGPVGRQDRSAAQRRARSHGGCRQTRWQSTV